MTSAGFEPTIPASEWPQTHAVDRAANGIGEMIFTTLTLSCVSSTEEMARPPEIARNY
jgi:hypothetical protein